MFLKILVVTVFLVAFVMLALGIKLLFNKNAQFPKHSCSLENDNLLGKDEACEKCDLEDLVEYPEK
ncbi:MAG TPA: hypothetical protein VEP89_16670 [Draconibacterium sp.]|nr:hypothetical protein [Draconibacterium sp.]